MSAPRAIGVPVFDLRLEGVGHLQPEPYALVVAAADCRARSQIASGTRREMKSLRNRLLIAVRSDPATIDGVASLLAKLARSLPPDEHPPEEPTRDD